MVFNQCYIQIIFLNNYIFVDRTSQVIYSNYYENICKYLIVSYKGGYVCIKNIK